ncbi:MAG: hypothetical protein WAM20_11835, partial [Acidobacteriaceae bacterium]
VEELRDHLDSSKWILAPQCAVGFPICSKFGHGWAAKQRFQSDLGGPMTWARNDEFGPHPPRSPSPGANPHQIFMLERL